MTAEELDARCEAQPELEELLMLVLDAAGDTATREKVVAYALALANGVRTDSSQERWESALIEAIRDLGSSHLELLDRLTRTSNQLGLGDGSEAFNTVPAQLNDVQMEMIARDLPALRSILAVLQRHGLVANTFVGSGGFVGVGHTIGYWGLTDFGRQVHELLKGLGDRLTSDDLTAASED